MSLILPHRVTIQGHAALSSLFRIRCTCGYEAFAPTEARALACEVQHLSDEEPFPDLSHLEEPTQ